VRGQGPTQHVTFRPHIPELVNGGGRRRAWATAPGRPTSAVADDLLPPADGCPWPVANGLASAKRNGRGGASTGGQRPWPMTLANRRGQRTADRGRPLPLWPRPWLTWPGRRPTTLANRSGQRAADGGRRVPPGGQRPGQRSLAGGPRPWPVVLANRSGQRAAAVDDGFHRVANAVANVACRRPTVWPTGLDRGPSSLAAGGRRPSGIGHLAPAHRAIGPGAAGPTASSRSQATRVPAAGVVPVW